MIKAKKIVMSLILILVFIFMISTHQIYSDNNISYKEKDSFNLLIIASYHQGHYWESFVLEGLEKKLNQNLDYDVNIKIEYLDFRNRDDEVYQKSFKSLLENKYQKGSIDIICAINDEAYNFIKNDILDKSSMFYEIPFVFCGVNQELEYTKDDAENIIGINDPADTFELIDLIENLNPNISNLNLIVENSGYGEEVISEVEAYCKEYINKNINITYIKGDYIDEITEQLIALSYTPNSANIIAGEFQYKGSNIFLKSEDTIKQIREYNSFPIFSNDQTYLEAGIVGGCVDIGQEHGRQAAELILSTVNGEDLSQIYTKQQPEPKIYLDYNGIYEYDIDPIKVPKDANIINKKIYQFLIPTEKKHVLLTIICGILICMLHITSKLIYTRKKYLQEKEKKKMMEDRLNLKSDFIVNLSHELRTPINIILNTTKVINMKVKRDDIDKDSIDEKLDIINNNSYRLLKISNNIIDITNSESGLFKLNKRNENIVDIVEDAFIASVEFANSKNITMVFNTMEEEIITGIDKTQMQRVVLNLLSNAIKYTNKGGSITVDLDIEDNYVRIKVQDTGIGIPKEKLDEIFYRFYQVDYSTQRVNEGSGMGLCIVKDIVEYHNGKITVESSIGQGSIFRVMIPIKLVDDKIDTKNIGYDVKTIARVEMSDVNK